VAVLAASRVRELGSIGIFSIFAITLSNVVRLLQSSVHKLVRVT